MYTHFLHLCLWHRAHQEQLGVRCLAQGRFDSGNRTSNLLITKQLLYLLRQSWGTLAHHEGGRKEKGWKKKREEKREKKVKRREKKKEGILYGLILHESVLILAAILDLVLVFRRKCILVLVTFSHFYPP